MKSFALESRGFGEEVRFAADWEDLALADLVVEDRVGEVFRGAAMFAPSSVKVGGGARVFPNKSCRQPHNRGAATYARAMSSDQVRVVNLQEKLGLFDEHWSPRTVAQFNGHDVMVVKVKGEFVWHHHDDTDDLFLVLKGRLTIRLPDHDVVLGPGELVVVPVGVDHQPFAEEETELLLIEPRGTPNTGDAETAVPRITI
jgi:mannose-6-phosphate isomerase-like protein (cupin superfamily)